VWYISVESTGIPLVFSGFRVLASAAEVVSTTLPFASHIDQLDWPIERRKEPQGRLSQHYVLQSCDMFEAAKHRVLNACLLRRAPSGLAVRVGNRALSLQNLWAHHYREG
jgi:hypothetical protein